MFNIYIHILVIQFMLHYRKKGELKEINVYKLKK